MSDPLDRLGTRAKTLREKLERTKHMSAAQRGEMQTPKQLEALRAFWASSLGGEEALQQRLAWEGLDEQAIPAMLSDDVCENRDDGSLEWVSFLRDVLRTLPGMHHGRDEDLVPFSATWLAFGSKARARLRENRRFGASVHGSPALSAKAWEDVGDFLVRRLAPIGTAVVFAEFARFRERHDPQGADQGTYGNWRSQFCEGGAAMLFSQHPVFARALITITLDAIAALEEWWERFTADWADLCRTFSLPAEIKEVTSLKLGLSDRHYHGRQALALTLSDGTRLVYKPKSIDLDAALGSLLQWLTRQSQGADNFPAPVKTLARPGYGWAEFIEHDSFASREEVERYYRRCGGLLAVVYALEGRDFTMDNLVATRGGPAAIDAETLLQPLCRPGGADEVHGEELAKLTERILRERDFSVLDTGMLPSWQASADPSAGFYDVSGMGGQTGYKAGVSADAWVDIGTTRMRAEKRAVDVPPELNVVTLDGQPCPAASHVHQITEGFADAYRLLLRLRDDPAGELMSLLESWKDAEVRFLLRATGIYGRTLQQMLLPAHLVHPVLSGAIAERLWKPFIRSASPPAIAPFLREEAESLTHFDIPCFHLPAHGDTRPFFLVSPLAMGLQRLKRLSEADMSAQLRMIRASFSIAPRKQPATFNPDIALQEALELAEIFRWCAKDLDDLPAPEAGGFGTESSASSSSHASLFLYDGGIAGRAIFFSALSRITGDPGHGEDAQQLLETLWNSTGCNEPFRDDAVGLPAGAASGIPSLVYTFLAAARILGLPSLRDHAAELAHLVTRESITNDRHFDVLCGAAGAALVFADAAHEDAREDVYRERAVWCGEHLLANACQLDGHGGLWWRGEIGECYLGYGHGAAGIGAAFARLFALTNDVRFRDAAQQVFDTLDTLFHEEKGRWPVLVREGGMSVYQNMEALCHGSAGIAFAAAEARRCGIDAGQTAPRALQVLAQVQPSPVDTLCCGNMGRIEALLANDQIDAAATLATLSLQRREACGVFRTSMKRSEHWTLPPSFFRGLSGMGYTLLRAAWPAELPSIGMWR
jgi:type 2 lantibiotic biosynthesis protein LanM